ncbi:MAG: anti-sigma regulatory factor [bacterium P3]|nr:MAG: anti-sigma regulatory factor [bacterium P3]KWW41072.1 MAG: anti-sigma regulatory factor [bacterium F083]
MSESLIVQSNDEGFRDVEDFLEQTLGTYHIAHYAATITIPVLQAVQNAIKHGNSDDSGKKVRVEAGRCQGGVYFEVEDEGNGFDVGLQLSNIMNAGQGRGLLLITTLADRYAYSNGGRTLRMEFDIEGVFANVAAERVSLLRRFYHHDVVEA